MELIRWIVTVIAFLGGGFFLYVVYVMFKLQLKNNDHESAFVCILGFLFIIVFLSFLVYAQFFK